MSLVKDHFETEATEFDSIILKLIPYYGQMIDALSATIPFSKTDYFDVIDLGCGTGTIAKTIAEQYPNSTITCLDLSENMIEMAKNKLSFHLNTRFLIKNFKYLNFDQKYHVVLSSLALHHLESDGEKKMFYQKIFNNLHKGGVFFNADVILGANQKIQNEYMNKWVHFMKKNIPDNEIENNWLKRYENEDHPSKLSDQLNWLSGIGFRDVDVIWKYYNFAVYGGVK
jgi:tRNA (cmo5U34)-methyltransferase